MTTLREAAIQALEALVRASSYYDTYAEIAALEAALAEHDKNLAWFKERKANWDLQRKLAEETQERDRLRQEDALQRFTDVNQEIEAALAEPVLTTCNCRWDGEVQVQQCTLHEAHVDAIKEWAQRAKFAEKKLAALAEPCPCGDRSAAECPGEWEPGCDLGNNPKYAKRVNLAEPVQEPVAWLWQHRETGRTRVLMPDERTATDVAAAWDVVGPLYLAPPQRKPMTKQQIQELSQQHKFDSRMEKFVPIIEQAHGIK